MVDEKGDFVRALGAYSQQELVVFTAEGHIRMPPGQPPMLGFDVGAEVQGRHLAEFVHPDDLADVLTEIERLRADAGGDDADRVSRVVSVRVRDHDSSWQQLHVTIFDARSDPAIDGFVLRLTKGSELQPPASDSHRFGMESLAEALSAGVIVADGRGHIVYVNRATCLLFGRTADELTGDLWESLMEPEDASELADATEHLLAEVGYSEATCRILPTDHLPRWVRVRISPLGGVWPPTGWAAVLNDITRQREIESDLAHQATHDPLTGLPNRLLLNDRLERAVSRLDHSRDRVAVMFLDIDDFKNVNDTLGHGVGDATLVELADRIRNAIRPGDTAARFSGDEFVIVAEGLDEAAAMNIAARVAAAARLHVSDGQDQIHLRTSIGVALARPGDKVAEVLNLADQAMYRAKRLSGDQVVLADQPSPSSGSVT